MKRKDFIKAYNYGKCRDCSSCTHATDWFRGMAECEKMKENGIKDFVVGYGMACDLWTPIKKLNY